MQSNDVSYDRAADRDVLYTRMNAYERASAFAGVHQAMALGYIVDGALKSAARAFKALRDAVRERIASYGKATRTGAARLD